MYMPKNANLQSQQSFCQKSKNAQNDVKTGSLSLNSFNTNPKGGHRPLRIFWDCFPGIVKLEENAQNGINEASPSPNFGNTNPDGGKSTLAHMFGPAVPPLLVPPDFGPARFGPARGWSRPTLVPPASGPVRLWSRRFWSRRLLVPPAFYINKIIQ